MLIVIAFGFGEVFTKRSIAEFALASPSSVTARARKQYVPFVGSHAIDVAGSAARSVVCTAPNVKFGAVPVQLPISMTVSFSAPAGIADPSAYCVGNAHEIVSA